jgi:molecular chaperone GrpE
LTGGTYFQVTHFDASGENHIMSEQKTAESAQIDAETEQELQEFLEVTETEVEVLNARVAELEAQLKDTQLRSQAEVRNIQMRADREVSNAHKFALEKFAGGLLEVVDNLERAMSVANPQDESLKSLIEGLQLTHKVFADTLKKFGVEAVDPTGQPFNAELHQAVATQPASEANPANTVITAFQKGYTLSGRLLRPAMVVVAQ